MSSFKEDIHVILEDLEEVLVSKNLDYGNSFDLQMNEFGLVAGVIRLNDKLSRLKQLSKENYNQQVNDESLYDTVKDMSGYAVLLLRWLDMEKKANDNS